MSFAKKTKIPDCTDINSVPANSGKQEGETGVIVGKEMKNKAGLEEIDTECKDGPSEHFSEICLVLRQSPAPKTITEKTITSSDKKVKDPQLDQWYHFDEISMSWIPMNFELQEKFDLGYMQAKFNPESRLTEPHIVFQICEIWYTVQFDFSSERSFPYGQQTRLGDSTFARTVVKAQPDAHNLINGISVQGL